MKVTAVAVSGQMGGTERVLLDFAVRAFEHDIALRVVSPRAGPLLDILNDNGVPAEVVPAGRPGLRGAEWVAGRATLPAAIAGAAAWAGRLRRHAVVAGADLVYTTGFKPHLTSVIGLGKPVVWHAHEFPPAITGAIWKALSRRVPTAIIANSEGVGAAWAGIGRLRSPGAAASTVTVIHNGVDLDRFRPRERTYWLHDRLGLPHHQRLVGMPAVLARWKGQLLVLDAFQRVASELTDTHLVLVGGSIYDTVAERRYEKTLRGAVQRATDAVGKRIHLVPFQPKVERVYPEFDVVLHYSVRPEAFGRVVLEAMACAVPIIAAAEGGPTEIVTQGGWLVPPRAPPALAAALRSALALPGADLARHGAEGRMRAEDRFSARRFAKQVGQALWHGAREGRRGRPRAGSPA